MMESLSAGACGVSRIAFLRRTAAPWLVAALVCSALGHPVAAEQPGVGPAGSPASFVLLSSAARPPEIVGKILCADNTRESAPTDGTYWAEKRSSGGREGNASRTVQAASRVMEPGEVLLLCAVSARAEAPAIEPMVLKPDAMRRYVERFNRHDRETVATHIPNAAAAAWLERNVPLLDCPDGEIEEIYYFRWWTYRKHVKQTPDGFVITEFLPEVGWAGKHNTISCAAGHHFYEGRWLADPQYLDDYARFWFGKGGEPRRYSFWAADSLWARYLVDGNRSLLIDLLPELIANFQAWEQSRREPSGLFWQIDDRDGMEVSIGGSGFRATINSYMYGDAVAIARIADLAGQREVADEYRRKAERIQRLVQERLWDEEAQFYKVLPRGPDAGLADVRELHGYTPWYFGLPEPRQAVAWKQLIDPQGFYAPFGPTTAERRHPRFMFEHAHDCQWNGPSWPYATSVTLTALANLLNGPPQEFIGKKHYLDLLHKYAASQHLKLADGAVVPWIDENLHPDTGEWIARSILESRGTKDRGKDYNHSTFCDLVISGLVGLRPRADDMLEVNPLVPDGAWDYFCLDGVRYRGRTITILYDRSGKRYGKGSGLRLFVDGRQVAASENIARITAPLPPVDASGENVMGIRFGRF